MGDTRRVRRILGTLLMVVGVVALVGAGAYVLQSQAQGRELRSQLRASAIDAADTEPDEMASPSPASTATAVVEPTVPATQTPLPTAPPASPTRPQATAAAEEDAGVQAEGAAREAAPVKATAVRRVVPTATTAPTTAPTRTPAGAATSGPVAVAAAASSVPVRLLFPDLSLDAKVVPMGWKVVQTKNGPSSEWEIPKNDAGHHINSASLGQPGNLVISGHNNIYGRVFMPISLAWDNDTRVIVDDFSDRSDILTGRRISLFDAAGKQYDYVVTEFYRLKDTGVSLQQRIANGRFIQPTEDTRLTIVTCWPPTNNTHRLVVVAVPAS